MTDASRTEFQRRLRRNLAAAERLLQRDGFGVGSTTIGAELELSLIDPQGNPAMRNREVLDAASDSHLTVELDRFNLEYNADPLALAGEPFNALRQQFDAALDLIDDSARALDTSPITIGTLPSLDLDILGDAATMTDVPRYRALAVALRSFRNRPFALDIDGADPLTASCDGVTLEGANTSFQIHLRVDPDKFAAQYNAVQLATPIALAVAGNSPLFCGHRLWEETRIAVFKQAVDLRPEGGGRDRPPRVCFGHGWTRNGVFELLAEAVHLHEPLLPDRYDPEADDPIAVVERGEVPPLSELRIHLGTIWRWNRPVFETAGPGHLRIELRALPSGPSNLDMAANAAFYLGLSLGLRDRIDTLIAAIPFEFARKNFYRAAQHGLSARLAWPAAEAPSPEYGTAAELALRLLPVAAEGLVAHGVNADHASSMLGIIEGRIRSGQTGARWQREFMTKRCGDARADAASLRDLTLRYNELSRSGQPVHKWPVG